MAGLVIKDLMGGDLAVALVSDKLWDQIREVPALIGEGERYAWRFAEVVGWLVCEDPECDRPDHVKGCPEARRGHVVKVWHCQSPVIEPCDLSLPISGMVYLLA